ncbi:uncharacterized protein si:ch211-266a5.12 [Esox lucius]|uniref:uncharacterized protein si:ch211-266a5.12 n=1 Tax=Esox lucius TaxID=8010 RepID=UPI0014769707|nr:uncharacterized protein si:ch211-266a5.12 [Esox lucius]XP_034143574.1 uncharacterized protein si:ch211-266a5.12 [Esox lucius]XP_034143575.1 uncharacterized protein si:ch211-266a5.12 [Esox lucius]XP_034143576.1 uncharacterized protein si:ch211-266a5.12 [Esox lucius]XP_034143577.1 uncharacterized protein si:ch211-266a5.12 [Esox lucius]XP_034143578.1 uncharacterized protein si:ch211-266a5.12 [Esox lucius]
MHSSSNVVQCLLLILLLAVKGQDGARSSCSKDDISVCVDMVKLQRLIQNVQKVFNTTHDERILLQAVTFDKIKKHKTYHGCVLLKILDFYEQVLQRQDVDYTHLRGLLDEVKDCVPRNKTCKILYHQAAEKRVNKAKIDQDLELLSKDITILQLQKLQAARKKVVRKSEKATLDKAMAELQQLDEYITGKGLRKGRMSS